MDDRRLTLIVVPHGELETRTFEISYRALKLTVIAASTLALVFAVIVGLWFPIASQAGRVPFLEREVDRLERERERVAALARTLAEVEAQYQHVRALLGSEGGVRQSDTAMPPSSTRQDSTPINAPSPHDSRKPVR